MSAQPKAPGRFSLVHWLCHYNPRRRFFAAATASLVLLAIIGLYRRTLIDAIGLPPLAHGEAAPENNADHVNSQPPTADMDISTCLIPPKVWQILLPKNATDRRPIDPKQLEETPSWLAMNLDCSYTLVGQAKADAFVQQHFADKPRIVDMYMNLSNPGMKSDFLRYLILDIEGGVYTDVDTVALKPIKAWVPADVRDQVRLVVGIEFDRRDGVAWADIPHWLQFAQWTIAAAPGHPVFQKMISHAIRAVKQQSEKHGVPVNELRPTSFEVMTSTGPAAWTDVVFEQLQEYEPALNTTADLSFMTEPKLYGDILVLNIDGFGMGQSHSSSTNDGTIPDLALVKHLFRGSWRHG